MIMPEFYRGLGPMTMWPVRALMNRLPLPGRVREVLFLLAMVGALVMETAMGGIFLFYPLLPRHALLVGLACNLFFHLYIITAIGLSHQVHTFIAWNAMCMALSQIIFSDSIPSCPEEEADSDL